MSKYIKLDDAISKIVNTPTRVITDDLTALADRQHEIIDMLSDLPTIEVSEDCISREYLLSKVYDMDNDNLVVDLKDIDNAPSVVPSRAEGEWNLELLEDGYYGARVVCSVCGHKHYDSLEKKYTKFCPDCGARMKGAKCCGC